MKHTLIRSRVVARGTVFAVLAALLIGCTEPSPPTPPPDTPIPIPGVTEPPAASIDTSTVTPVAAAAEQEPELTPVAMDTDDSPQEPTSMASPSPENHRRHPRRHAGPPL